MKKAVLYARVSTGKQAERDLSLPDQIKQMENWCEVHGYEVVEIYEERGVSATDDRRPAFQKMVADVCENDFSIDSVIVHSFSRFYRDTFGFTYYVRKLDHADIKLISITQDIGDSSEGVMIRNIISIFDEYSSKENGKHTLRAMIECARQGYFPGSKPPYGYKRELENENDSKRKKWKLAVEPDEAEIVRQIFHLSIHGLEGVPYGAKKITEYLNSRGVLRRGKKWSRATVGEMLNDKVYIGEYFYNKKSGKNRKKYKPRGEWVQITVPAIVTKDTFEKSSKDRKDRAPTSSSSALTSPTLLTGLLKCSCGSAMTLATGKGGRYRYYKCTKRINVSKDACDSKNIPVEKLDALVLKTLADKVFIPERVLEIVSQCQKKLRDTYSDEKKLLEQMRRDIERERGAENNLLDAISEGASFNDAMREKLQSHQNRQEEIKNEIATLERIIDVVAVDLNEELVERFCVELRNKFLDSESQFGKAYLNMLVEEIKVKGEEVCITGRNVVMIGALNKSGVGNSLGVPTPDRAWLRLLGSNQRQAD